MKEHQHTNSLINETSPYLLQHAHNPVDWRPWNEETLALAKKENKPLLISIGYSACHWCHVMEHESFEDTAVAAIMNKYFVCIKVDREERPDVDQLYMSAVQLMTKRGGWPLNAIALPDGRPFWGGTYFPKENWVSILEQIANLYQTDRNKVEEYAQQLSQGIRESASVHDTETNTKLNKNFIGHGVALWKERLDYENGGNLGSPKFMIPSNLQFLGEFAFLNKDKRAADYVETTLEKIALGGLYDQVGGGFARYSTDKVWKIPHFEKMLYDNAQLVSLYSQMYRKNKSPFYKRIVYQTIEFIQRELMSKERVFYSALDADSEGEEGKFYVWKKEELQEVLKDDFDDFALVYNINSVGYWEHDNYILHRTESDEALAGKLNIDINAFYSKQDAWQKLLLAKRSERIRPGLDDKSLTSWNAMMGEALVEAYLSFDDPEFLDLALANATAINKLMTAKDGRLFHSYKNGIRKINGFLEDYAFVISFYNRLFQASTGQIWLERSSALMEKAILNFSDEDQLFFWFSDHESSLPVTRSKEVYDNVIPSSNSVMAHNLFVMGHLLGKTDMIVRSEQMAKSALSNFHEYPSGYSNWARLALYHQKFYEIAVVGENAEDLIRSFHTSYFPNVVFCGSALDDLYLTKDRLNKAKTQIYVCENNACLLPVETVAEARKQVNKVE